MLQFEHNCYNQENMQEEVEKNYGEYPLIPKQAFLIFPQGKDVFFQAKNTVKRSIFGDSRYPQYTQFENNKILHFVQFLKNNKHTVNIVNQNQKTLLLKLVYANKFNFQNALKNFKQWKEWQNQFMPLSNISPTYKQRMEDLLKTGLFYCTPSRDQYCKPIVIVHVGRILKVKPQQQLFLDAFGYFLQSIIEKMMIDGQLQTWNVIVDVDQTSVFSFAGALFDLIKFLSKIFIGRMYRCYIVDYPFLIKFVWGTVALMMDAQQNQKCKILTKAQMLRLIPKQALQQRYGGDIPTLEHFWPLDSPQRIKIQKQSQQHMRSHWFNENNLVSESQYYERYQQDKIGNKKCQQIIKKFEAPQEEIKQNEINSNESVHFQKLTPEQSNQLNRTIPLQKKPLSIKVINQLRQSQQYGDYPFRKSTQNLISLQKQKQKQKSQQKKSTNKKSQNKSKKIEVKNGQQDQNSTQQHYLINQHIESSKVHKHCIYIRKQIFHQLGYQNLFE